MGETDTFRAHGTFYVSGDGGAASGEAGSRMPLGRVSDTPFAAIDYGDLRLYSYDETGASVSNGLGHAV